MLKNRIMGYNGLREQALGLAYESSIDTADFKCLDQGFLTLEGPSTSIDVFSFRNACKMASVKSYDTIFSEFYFFINTCLLSKFQDFSASGYRKKYVTT